MDFIYMDDSLESTPSREATPVGYEILDVETKIRKPHDESGELRAAITTIEEALTNKRLRIATSSPQILQMVKKGEYFYLDLALVQPERIDLLLGSQFSSPLAFFSIYFDSDGAITEVTECPPEESYTCNNKNILIQFDDSQWAQVGVGQFKSETT